MTKKEVGDVKKQLLAKKKVDLVQASDFLSTGSTLLNLACSGRVRGGFKKGLCHLMVGDSSSGKSWLCLSCMAEASINKNFDKYRFIHDNVENGTLMDLQRYFGDKLFDRIEPPYGTKKVPEYSRTSEEFYRNINRAINKGTPFIWVEDSMDALDTMDDLKQMNKETKASEDGVETTGSYGTAKAKMNSQRLRSVCNGLKDTGSILLLVYQTRQNLGFGAKFKPKVRAGGNAPRFYSRIEMWTSIKERLKSRVRGKERQVGILAKIKIEKNHICGWEGEITIPIYRSIGIDDLGSCCDYLIEEKHWKAKDEGKIILAEDFDFEGKREALIRKIEEDGNEHILCVWWGACGERSKMPAPSTGSHAIMMFLNDDWTRKSRYSKSSLVSHIIKELKRRGVTLDNVKKEWTPDEDDILLNGYMACKSIHDLVADTDRTPDGIDCRLESLLSRSGRNWAQAKREGKEYKSVIYVPGRLRDNRTEEPYNVADLTAVRSAFNKSGIALGANCAEHVANVTARSVKQAQYLINETARPSTRGWGFVKLEDVITKDGAMHENADALIKDVIKYGSIKLGKYIISKGHIRIIDS